MKIEKINTNKIQITLNIEDLFYNKIDVHSFMSNPHQNTDLFLHILDLAKKQVGFSTDNYELEIETIILNKGTFIFNITRFKPNLHTFKRKKEVSPLKSLSDINSCFFCFNSYDDFIYFYSTLKKISLFDHLKDCNYSLFAYNEKLYLSFKASCINTTYQTLLLSVISEFASPVSSNIYYNLLEYGNCLCSNKIFK